MEIETDRLIIRTFDMALIDALHARNLSKLHELGYIATEEFPDDELYEVLPMFREMLSRNGMDGFNSWLILDKNKAEIIGSAGFIAKPDENGDVEMGFGIVPGKRRKGFGTEAAKAIADWAFSQKSVRCVRARCDEGNIGSKAILKRIGMKEKGGKDGVLAWELVK